VILYRVLFERFTVEEDKKNCCDRDTMTGEFSYRAELSVSSEIADSNGSIRTDNVKINFLIKMIRDMKKVR